MGRLSEKRKPGYLRDERDNPQHEKFVDQTEHLSPIGVVPLFLRPAEQVFVWLF